MTPQYTVVVFDLDDTLIDTAGVLLPDALRRVAEAAGVPVERLDPSGKKIDAVLAPAGELDVDARAAAAAAWYAPVLPDLEPVPGARAMLAALQGTTRLFLLTRGDPERQQAKVDRAGLRDYFEDVIVRPIEQPGSKRDDLEAILARCEQPPDRCLVVGDDEHDELRHARDLGCLALHVDDADWATLPALVSGRSV